MSVANGCGARAGPTGASIQGVRSKWGMRALLQDIRGFLGGGDRINVRWHKQ